ncbi:hypothetical protein BKP42_58640 [Rhodococcus erythropolis]|nr:hypothetical protein BKP42_58640 [Rhodococcus erythropolis]
MAAPTRPIDPTMACRPSMHEFSAPNSTAPERSAGQEHWDTRHQRSLVSITVTARKPENTSANSLTVGV